MKSFKEFLINEATTTTYIKNVKTVVRKLNKLPFELKWITKNIPKEDEEQAYLKFELKYKSEIIYGNEVGDYDTQFKEIASLIKNILDLKAIKVISNNDMANVFVGKFMGSYPTGLELTTGRNKIYGNIIINDYKLQ